MAIDVAVERKGEREQAVASVIGIAIGKPK
jgi:hypothetical protein